MSNKKLISEYISRMKTRKVFWCVKPVKFERKTPGDVMKGSREHENKRWVNKEMS